MPTDNSSPATTPVRAKKVKSTAKKRRMAVRAATRPPATIIDFETNMQNASVPSLADLFAPLFDAPSVAPAPTPIKRPSFYSFVKTAAELEGSEWTTARIGEALSEENWREREVGETIKEFDVIQLPIEGGTRYEYAQCLKDQIIIAEDMEAQGYVIHTMEGGGKPKRPVVYRQTSEFTSLLAVPKGVMMKLPIEEKEAARFFGCDVTCAVLAEKGQMKEYYYPVPKALIDRRYRMIFSRVFSDFTKKHLREKLRSLIPNRGAGIRLKPGVSIKSLLRIRDEGKMVESICPTRKSRVIQKWVPLTADEVYNKARETFRVEPDTIKSLLQRHDYQPKGLTPVDPFATFVSRMTSRALKPDDFRYEKAVGIEIETVCTVNHEAAQKMIPHFMRATTDGSITTSEGVRPRDTGGALYGVEFRILVNRDDLERKVNRATEALNKLDGKGVKVNKSCGLHVHFDMRNKPESEVTELATKMSKWLRLFKDLVPKARRNNSYCNFDCDLNQHYSAVSLEAFRRHKTIEVRAHSATTSPVKILKWIALLEAIMAVKFAPPSVKTTSLDALKTLGLPKEDLAYWMVRHHDLNRELYPDKPDTSVYGEIQGEDEGIEEVANVATPVLRPTRILGAQAIPTTTSWSTTYAT